MGTVLTNKGEKILVDDDMLDTLNQRKWNIHNGYAEARFGSKVLKMHRVIIDAPKGMEVDHINLDKLDNRKSNLRLVTHAQNMNNRAVFKTSASGFKGVTYDKSMSRRKRWGASILHNGKRIKIGRYFTAEEAALAYDNIASKLKGEYARLNFRRIES